MHRLRRIDELWRWLPAFRAVAELEHLHDAARRLCVSAPALSRTLRLLEEAIGQPLFGRVGGRLTLNRAGRGLLDTVRDGMRALDDTLARLDSDPFAGEIRIGLLGLAADALALEALASLCRDEPRAAPYLVRPTARAAETALLAGELDVVVLEDDLPDVNRSLWRRCLGEVPRAVYCGAGHPLFAIPGDVAHEDLSKHRFVVSVDAGGAPNDGWPGGRDRAVGVRVSEPRLALEFCAKGQLLAVLPEIATEGTGLRRSAGGFLAPARVFAMMREPLPSQTRGPGTELVGRMARILEGRTAERRPASATGTRPDDRGFAPGTAP